MGPTAPRSASLKINLLRGDSADWRLFSEWLVVSKGRRTLEWSRGLRALLLPDDVDLSDEEIAAEVEPAVPVAAIAPDVWRELVRRGLTTDTLEAVEAQGSEVLVVLVRAAGLDVGLERQDLGPPQLVLELPEWLVGLEEDLREGIEGHREGQEDDGQRHHADPFPPRPRVRLGVARGLPALVLPCVRHPARDQEDDEHDADQGRDHVGRVRPPGARVKRSSGPPWKCETAVAHSATEAREQDVAGSRHPRHHTAAGPGVSRTRVSSETVTRAGQTAGTGTIKRLRRLRPRLREGRILLPHRVATRRRAGAAIPCTGPGHRPRGTLGRGAPTYTEPGRPDRRSGTRLWPFAAWPSIHRARVPALVLAEPIAGRGGDEFGGLGLPPCHEARQHGGDEEV